MAKHTIGVIGFGGIAEWHLRAVERLGADFKFKGGYDVREEALQNLVKNGLRAYKTAEELLSDKEIDIVLVATPNDVHKDYCIAALRAGKNVICEKPVTMNTGELEEIIEVQNETGKVFTVHQNRRFDKDFLIVKKLKEEGLIGKIYALESRVTGGRQVMYGWRGEKANGGGMLLDWGVHLIDQALTLTDSPLINVDAHLFSLFNEVDDCIKLLLRFEGGESFLLEMSTNNLIEQPRWHVSGTEGTCRIDNWECEGKVIRSVLNSDSHQYFEKLTYGAGGPTKTMIPLPEFMIEQQPLPEVEKIDSTAQIYGNLADVIDSGCDLIVKPAEVLRTMRAVDAAFESERLKKSIACRI